MNKTGVCRSTFRRLWLYVCVAIGVCLLFFYPAVSHDWQSNQLVIAVDTMIRSLAIGLGCRQLYLKSRNAELTGSVFLLCCVVYRLETRLPIPVPTLAPLLVSLAMFGLTLLLEAGVKYNPNLSKKWVKCALLLVWFLFTLFLSLLIASISVEGIGIEPAPAWLEAHIFPKNIHHLWGRLAVESLDFTNCWYYAVGCFGLALIIPRIKRRWVVLCLFIVWPLLSAVEMFNLSSHYPVTDFFLGISLSVAAGLLLVLPIYRLFAEKEIRPGIESEMILWASAIMLIFLPIAQDGLLQRTSAVYLIPYVMGALISCNAPLLKRYLKIAVSLFVVTFTVVLAAKGYLTATFNMFTNILNSSQFLP